MFAVVKTGGKQYKVSTSDVIRVEKIDAEVGSNFELSNVLMIFRGHDDVVLDKESLQSVKVVTRVMAQMRDKKVIVFKKRRRHNYRRKLGHRQPLTVLKIESISL